MSLARPDWASAGMASTLTAPPLSQRRACSRLVPVNPTMLPLSLMPHAWLVSVPGVASRSMVPLGVHRTARITPPASSAKPTTVPLSLIALAWL